MKIAFCDYSDIEYQPDTPYIRPIGGTQSAVCYLMEELVKLGVDVTLVNTIKAPGSYLGVKCPGLKVDLNEFDFVVVINGALGKKLRSEGVRTKLILWTGHDVNQPSVASLKDPEERGCWDKFIFVSIWQSICYQKAFGIWSSHVLRNAISPFFEQITKRPLKLTAPTFAYTSTPFRGLDVLLLAFPTIHKAFPESRLKIFSAMNIYNIPNKVDAFTALYELAKVLPGVEYIGPVEQKQLAVELADVDILAYPNRFAETSCIAAMEAMGAGCLIYTSNLGALPETLANFGLLTEVPPDTAIHAKLFADVTIGATRAAITVPQAIEERIKAQQEYVREHYTWKKRALEWIKVLESWK